MTITSFFNIVADGVTGAVSAFANLFSGLVPLFWTTAESGPGSPTVLLIFIVAGVALSLAFWAIDKIIGLARIRGGSNRTARRRRA